MSERADWLVDIGHSRVKWGSARGGRLDPENLGACALDQPEALIVALTAGATGSVWLSGQSNSETVAQITDQLSRAGLSLQPVKTGAFRLPVAAPYPQLGSDRWLALQWPWQQSRRSLCVIDCGTAITVDVVDGSGRHLGGWIMAGLTSLRESLLQRARGLPRDELPVEALDLPALDSSGAIGRGTALQAIAAIDRAVAGAGALLGESPELWLTGGEAGAVDGHLARSTQRDDWLVLRGLAMLAEAA